MSKFKLVEVSNNREDWITRNGVVFNVDGSVVCIGEIDSQLDDDYVVKTRNLSWYKHYREIKEPTWKPFPDNVSTEHLKDCWFRNKHNKAEYRCIGYDSNKKNCVFMLGNSWYSRGVLFNEYEVKLNGEWQPVGIKE